MLITVAQALEHAGIVESLPGELARTAITGLEYDSRRVEPGHLFFAFLGQKVDGRRFAPQARERGAMAVVAETAQPEFDSGPWIRVEHARQALALAARTFYRPVAGAVLLTGITGTNGKTTTAYLIDSILRTAGKTTAMIGTIEYLLAGKPRSAVNTTPESLDLYRMFAELEQLGGTHATLEVSSHALAQGRVHGMGFHTAVFTNLTRDHLDFHSTMEEYFAAKCMFFLGRELPAPRHAVLNRDDPWSGRIPVAENVSVLWYGINGACDVRAANVRADFEGLHLDVEWRGKRYAVRSPLLGRMNAYNLLAAFGAGLSHELPLEAILSGVAACRSVPGRFERINEGQPFLVVVDYAHTDDALRNVIAAARSLGPKRVITLFGCGGDRDRSKRPLMGQAAAEASDLVVLTSDNPRSEDPLAIMNDALVGLRRFDTPLKVEPDRESAIRITLREARAGDIVLITGKGHEPYQILKDRTIAFDDREVAERALRELGYTRGEG